MKQTKILATLLCLTAWMTAASCGDKDPQAPPRSLNNSTWINEKTETVYDFDSTSFNAVTTTLIHFSDDSTVLLTLRYRTPYLNAMDTMPFAYHYTNCQGTMTVRYVHYGGITWNSQFSYNSIDNQLILRTNGLFYGVFFEL